MIFTTTALTRGVAAEVEEVGGSTERARSVLGVGDIPGEPVVVPEGRHATLPRYVVVVVAHHQSLEYREKTVVEGGDEERNREWGACNEGRGREK